MKVDDKCIEYIQKVINVATLVGLESVIIEPNKVRAMDDDGSVLLFQDNGVPSMPFGSIGLSNLKDFNNRLELAKSQNDFTMDALTTGQDDKIGYDLFDPKSGEPSPMWAKTLTMSGKHIKIEYRCANPQTIRTVKFRSGKDVYMVPTDDEKLLTMIQKGKAAMKSDEITFIGDSKGVRIEIADINGDVLEYKFADEVDPFDEDNEDPINFSYTYYIDLIIPLIKHNEEKFVTLSGKGAMSASLNGLRVYVAAGV